MSNSQKQKQTYRSSADPRNQHQQTTKKTVYTCWRCEKMWDSAEKLQQDTVRCPHCGMIHGHITNQ
jgi:Zn finger protein HypA/HybF involved in hydrogenase expression